MNCANCGRELREDSRFCDRCGTPVQREEQAEIKSSLNTNLLIGGIIFSILLTLIVTGLARSLGIPLLFGGLFLPFFWQIGRRHAKRE